jgi:hypothetical protein
MHFVNRWGALLGLAVGVVVSVAHAAAPVVDNYSTTGTKGYDFYYSIFASNSPTSYGASGLPGGLVLSGSSISGRPTVAGDFSVTLSASNADGTGTKVVTFAIDPGPSGPPVITNPPTIDTHYEGDDRDASYASWGIIANNRPQTYGVSGLPPNVYFESLYGRVYYNSAPPGLYPLTLSATNPAGTGTAQVQWAVHPAIVNMWPSPRSCAVGQTLTINFNFNGPVNVSGTPILELKNTMWSASSPPRVARYASGSGTATLHFTYIAQPEDVANGIEIGPIELNGATLTHTTSGVSAYTGYPPRARLEEPRTFNIYHAPVITSPTTASATVATPFSYTITATHSPVRYSVIGLPEGLSVDGSSGVISGTPVDSGSFSLTLQAWPNQQTGPATATLTLTISDSPTGRPTIVTQPASAAASAGASVTFSAASSAANATYQWQLNGANITNATASTLTVGNAQPAHTGIYSVVVTDQGQFTFSNPAILGLASTAKVIGTASEIGPDIVHANGNVYDQILPNGGAATVTADAGQVVRLSFVDFSDDIVQVEFSGAGTLSLVLNAVTGPAEAKLYNQPGVSYMRGHAGITITGADETTNVSVFSVGPVTAVNQTLFRSDVTYDGVADLAFIAILSPTGKFGGIRCANTNFWATAGFTGIYAPGIQFYGPVNVCEITATENAIPVLMLGSAADTFISGGDLLQTNGRAVQVSGL